MIGNGKKDMAVIVVRDADAVVAALREELGRAAGADRPGPARDVPRASYAQVSTQR